MIYVLSKMVGGSYKYIAKPILFRFSPDGVHELMIRTGNLLQRSKLFCRMTRKVLAYDDQVLHTTVLGIDFKSPLGLSAGLDKDAKIVKMAHSIGFGFIECGSVTFDAYEGNKKPWYTRLPKSRSIIVNSGLKSEGAHKVIARTKKYPASMLKQFPLNISIAKTNSKKTATKQQGIDDYVASFELWEKTGNARYYTINISCPNTFGGEPFTTPQDLDDLLQAVDKLRVRRPVFVKFPIDKTWPETKKLLDVCARHAVQGITLGNLYKDRATVQLQEKFDTSIKGNFSGKPCWEKSNELLEKMYAHYNHRFVFSGVGGVFSAEDAYTKIRLGASVVEFITGLIFQGPAVVGQMNRELAALLKRDGFEHVSDAIGVDVKQMKEK
jgi:dihydroorotate dehydrogenase (fumarate)